MKNFSIAGLQLDLEYTNNKTHLIDKINQTVSRYPWINMVVATELAVGGASRSQEFSLDNHLRSFQELAKEKNVCSLITTRSHAIANETPAPAAPPSIAEITGFEQLYIASIVPFN